MALREVENLYFQGLRTFVVWFIEMPAHNMDWIILFYVTELRQQISELQELRQQGLRRLQAAHVYYRLKASREDERLHRHHLGDVVNHLQIFTALGILSLCCCA